VRLRVARAGLLKPARRPIGLWALDPRARDLWRDVAVAWAFSSIGQSIVEDLGPNGLHGVLGSNINPTTDWVGSRYGGALRFTGQTNDKLTVPDPGTDALDATSRLSVELLIRPAVLGSAGTIYGLVGKYRPSNGLRSWRIFHDGDEVALQVSGDGIANEVQITTAANLVIGTWYQLLVTYDAGVFRVYKDGRAVAVDADFGSQVSIFGGTQELLAGQRTTSGGAAEAIWTGDLASLRIWRGRALTADDARELFENPWAMYDVGLLPTPAVVHSGSVAAGSWVSAGVVAAGVEALTIGGLTNGVSYDLKAEAVDLTGNRSAGSSPVSGTPAPAAPGWLGRLARKGLDTLQGAPGGGRLR